MSLTASGGYTSICELDAASVFSRVMIKNSFVRTTSTRVDDSRCVSSAKRTKLLRARIVVSFVANFGVHCYINDNGV